MRSVQALAAVVLSLLAVSDAALAAEPKQGGILQVYHRDSPGSASIHEGATYSLNVPFMPISRMRISARNAFGLCGSGKWFHE